VIVGLHSFAANSVQTAPNRCTKHIIGTHIHIICISTDLTNGNLVIKLMHDVNIYSIINRIPPLRIVTHPLRKFVYAFQPTPVQSQIYCTLHTGIKCVRITHMPLRISYHTKFFNTVWKHKIRKTSKDRIRVKIRVSVLLRDGVRCNIYNITLCRMQGMQRYMHNIAYIISAIIITPRWLHLWRRKGK